MYFHVSIHFCVRNDSCFLFSFTNFHHNFCFRRKRKNYDTFFLMHSEETLSRWFMNPTCSASNTLTTSWEVDCLPHCHLSNVQIILAYVRRCFLRNKLVKSMPIVGDFTWTLWKQKRYTLHKSAVNEIDWNKNTNYLLSLYEPLDCFLSFLIRPLTKSFFHIQEDQATVLTCKSKKIY